MTAAAPSLLLPEGTCLVHIGPPKTGTTSLQASLHANREALLAQGVRYAGERQHSRQAAYAALQRPAYHHLSAPPPLRLWQALADEVHAAPEPRVIVSSEIFTDGDPDAIARVVGDLGPERVHIAVTLRPIPRVLASQWQQGLKGGYGTPFDTWLRNVFDGSGAGAQRFWHRHRHDRLIARWAEVVGLDRVTVVVVDERDHGMVLRAFEQLLGLRTGTLTEIRERSNRSMTQPEAEAVRAFNVAAMRMGLSPKLQFRIRRRIVRTLLSLTPIADEPPISAPGWALDRASEISRQVVDAIVASGVHVVGDVEALAAPSIGSPTGDPVAQQSVTRSMGGAMRQIAALYVRRRRHRGASRPNPARRTGS